MTDFEGWRTLVFALYATLLPGAFDAGLWGILKVAMMLIGGAITLVMIASLFEGPYAFKAVRGYKDRG